MVERIGMIRWDTRGAVRLWCPSPAVTGPHRNGHRNSGRFGRWGQQILELVEGLFDLPTDPIEQRLLLCAVHSRYYPERLLYGPPPPLSTTTFGRDGFCYHCPSPGEP